MTRGAKIPRGWPSLGLAASQTLAGAAVGGGIQDTLRRSLSSKPRATHPVARSVQTMRLRYDEIGFTLDGGGDFLQSDTGLSGIWRMSINVSVVTFGGTVAQLATVNSTIAATGDSAIDGNLNVSGELAYDGTTDGLVWIVQGPVGVSMSVDITATGTRIAPL